MTIEEEYTGFIKFDKVVQFHDRFSRKLVVKIAYTNNPTFVYGCFNVGYIQNGHFNGANSSDKLIDHIKMQMENNEVFMAVYNAYQQYKTDVQGVFRVSDDIRCTAYNASRKFWDTCKPYFETPVDFTYTEYIEDTYTIHCTYDKYNNIPHVYIAKKLGEQWLMDTLYPNETDLEKLKQIAHTEIGKGII